MRAWQKAVLVVFGIIACGAGTYYAPGIMLKDEGVAQAQILALNCVGDAISCTTSNAEGSVTITTPGTAPPVAVTLGATNTEGVSFEHARADHVHSTSGFTAPGACPAGQYQIADNADGSPTCAQVQFDQVGDAGVTYDAQYVNIVGDTMTGKLTIDVGGASLAIKPALSDHAFIEWYADTAAPGTRSAYAGYPSAGSPTFALVNQVTNGNLDLYTAGTGGIRLLAGGSDKFRTTPSGSILGDRLKLNGFILQNGVTNDDLAYDGDTLPQYGLAWYNDSSPGFTGATGWLSGYYGLRLATGGMPRLSIANNGDVTIASSKLNVGGAEVFRKGVDSFTAITGSATRAQLPSYGYVMEIGSGSSIGSIRIKTTIPFTSGTVMPIIIFEAYAYGRAEHFHSMLSWYAYDSPTDSPDTGVNFVNHAVTHFGAWRPTIELAEEGGYISIRITATASTYYPRILVRGGWVGQSGTEAMFEGWTWDEAAFDAGATDITPVPDKSAKAANIGSLATGAIAATNVQSAIEELEAEKFAKTGGTLTGNLTVANSASNSHVEIGDDSGLRHALIDLHGASTYTDYGARLIRYAGDNGGTELRHRGTGSLRVMTEEAATITLHTGNTQRLAIGQSSIQSSLPISPTTDTGQHLGSNSLRWNQLYAVAVSDGLAGPRFVVNQNQASHYLGAVADGATSIAHRFGNANAFADPSAKIAAFYRDNLTTEVAAVDYWGTFFGAGVSDAAGTAGVYPSAGELSLDADTRLVVRGGSGPRVVRFAGYDPDGAGLTPAFPDLDLTYEGSLKSGGSIIWHAGNDGAGSTLDADLLDGADSTTFVEVAGDTMTGELVNEAAIRWSTSPTLPTCNGAQEGKVIRGGGGTSGIMTKLCFCVSDGAATPVYVWQNLASAALGTATSCPDSTSGATM